uniref:Uncharacterized protein n=1 Tax=Branchiostoma floridae TaxID=7739 RepID=C4A0F7_BRAFL|eukprot:XP_002585707.1 hypothetical protein BRAFLDRAFT_111406 [Branchiostoma floridae]
MERGSVLSSKVPPRPPPVKGRTRPLLHQKRPILLTYLREEGIKKASLYHEGRLAFRRHTVNLQSKISSIPTCPLDDEPIPEYMSVKNTKAFMATFRTIFPTASSLEAPPPGRTRVTVGEAMEDWAGVPWRTRD